jgi:hypothetical protein
VDYHWQPAIFEAMASGKGDVPEAKDNWVEMRRVDMRDVYPSQNAMAPLPPGETMYKGPARFETASPLAERLDVQLNEADGGAILTLRYGDRRLAEVHALIDRRPNPSLTAVAPAATS